MVEAYPEYGMRHLSAESALYCRIFTEGILGIEPTGFKTFEVKPEIPNDWSFFELDNVYILGAELRFRIERIDDGSLEMEIYDDNKVFMREEVVNGQRYSIRL